MKQSERHQIMVNDIKKRYIELSKRSVRVEGVFIELSFEQIVKVLSKKFYRSEATLKNMILGYGIYKNKENENK